MKDKWAALSGRKKKIVVFIVLVLFAAIGKQLL